MAETTWAALRGLLIERYEDFSVRLARRLGSEELASESLHETWLRLQRQGNAGDLQSPSAFVFRVAVNIARDHLRAERRRASQSEIATALGMADRVLDPARTVEVRFALNRVERAIRQLPERSRSILLASRLEGLTHQTIARRLGVSRRTVQYELERAVRYLEAQLDKNDDPDCADQPPGSS